MSLGNDDYQKSINTSAPDYDAHSCLYLGTLDCATNEAKTKKSLEAIYRKYVQVKNNNSPNVKTYAAQDLVAAYLTAITGVTQTRDDSENNAYRRNLDKLFNEVEQARNDLDMKLETVYNLPGSHGYEYKSHYESTIMSGVLWGTLAITMVYYVFYKK
jgi:hypothetical protein